MHSMIKLIIAAFLSTQVECIQKWDNEHHITIPNVEYHEDKHSLVSEEDYHHNIPSYQGPIAVPYVLANGHLADTHEVAEAKSHHLQAVAEAKSAKYYSGHQESSYGGAYGYSSSHHGYGIPVVLPNGHIADTLEVAAAKATHILAVDKVKSEKHSEGHDQDKSHEYSGSYHGYGIPVVLSNGHLADTHEVAAAKSAHMAAVAHANVKVYSHHNHQEHEHSEHQLPHYPTNHLTYQPEYKP